jgi:hypothetical protein
MEVLLVNVEPAQTRTEDPSSERWLEYYRDAKARRRARGPQDRTRVKLKRWRNRQRAFMVGGFVALGVLVVVFYAVLAQ